MHHLPVPRWLHHVHMPKRNDIVVGLRNLFHDEIFWAVVGATALIGTLLIISMFAANAQAPETPTTTLPPIVPFTY